MEDTEEKVLVDWCLGFGFADSGISLNFRRPGETERLKNDDLKTQSHCLQG
jgi:hypothetical protein